MAMKVIIDADNGNDVQIFECDGVICGCVTLGKGPTGIWVTTVDGGLDYADECRALIAMNAAVYGRIVDVVGGEE